MTYSPDTHIRTEKDVKAFFHHLVDERKVNFHPDDDFADYISIDDKTPPFSNDEVSLYNRLMDECLGVCEKDVVDIYQLGLEEMCEVES